MKRGPAIIDGRTIFVSLIKPRTLGSVYPDSTELQRMNAIQIPRAEMFRLIIPLILKAVSCVKYNVGDSSNNDRDCEYHPDKMGRKLRVLILWAIVSLADNNTPLMDG